jgi:hypothetical protein
MLLLQAAIAALVAYGLSPAVATLLVAGAVLILGLVLLWLGAARLRIKNLAPTKTINQVERDVSAIRSEVVGHD